MKEVRVVFMSGFEVCQLLLDHITTISFAYKAIQNLTYDSDEDVAKEAIKNILANYKKDSAKIYGLMKAFADGNVEVCNDEDEDIEDDDDVSVEEACAEE